MTTGKASDAAETWAGSGDRSRSFTGSNSFVADWWRDRPPRDERGPGKGRAMSTESWVVIGAIVAAWISGMLAVWSGLRIKRAELRIEAYTLASALLLPESRIQEEKSWRVVLEERSACASRLSMLGEVEAAAVLSLANATGVKGIEAAKVVTGLSDRDFQTVMDESEVAAKEDLFRDAQLRTTDELELSCQTYVEIRVALHQAKAEAAKQSTSAETMEPEEEVESFLRMSYQKLVWEGVRRAARTRINYLSVRRGLLDGNVLGFEWLLLPAQRKILRNHPGSHGDFGPGRNGVLPKQEAIGNGKHRVCEICKPFSNGPGSSQNLQVPEFRWI